MRIEYDDNVRNYFDKFIKIQSKWPQLSKPIKKRIDALRAANTFDIYLKTALGKPHSLNGDNKGMYGISIDANRRLIVQPKTIDLSAESLKNCDTIIIKGVVDYHGSKSTWIIP